MSTDDNKEWVYDRTIKVYSASSSEVKVVDVYVKK